jgi:cell division septum initiation protein DivIVA
VFDTRQSHGAVEMLRQHRAQLQASGRRGYSTVEVDKLLDMAFDAVEGLENYAGQLELRDDEAMVIERGAIGQARQTAVEVMLAGTEQQCFVILESARVQAAEIKAYADSVLASAKANAVAMVDAAQAEARAALVVVAGLPPRPELPDDEMARALVQADFLQTVGNWLRQESGSLQGDIQEAIQRLHQAQSALGATVPA